MRSLYFCLMRSASALRFSKGCSSLNFERILALCCGLVGDEDRWLGRLFKGDVVVC